MRKKKSSSLGINVYKALAEMAKDAILAIDENSNILFFNKAAENIFGWGRNEVIGEKNTIIIPNQYRKEHIHNVASYIKTGHPNKAINNTLELTAIKKNGDEFPIELSLSKVKLETKTIFTAIIRDITKRKKAEKKLEEAYEELKELNKLKDDIISFTGHELRTPMSSILGYSELLLDINLSLENRIEYANIILSETKRVSRIIENLLDIKRIESKSYQFDSELIDINALLLFSIDSIKNECLKRSIRIQTSIAKNIPMIIGNPDRLIQVFTNILLNACKYSHNNGSIKVSSTKTTDNHYKITFSDQGIGIPPNELNYIFNLFIRGSNCSEINGNGLGLTLCKMIIENAFKGTIVAESKGENKGASFIVKLPLNSSQN